MTDSDNETMPKVLRSSIYNTHRYTVNGSMLSTEYPATAHRKIHIEINTCQKISKHILENFERQW